MNLLPAIDLYEQKAVRLHQGDYAKMTVYSDDPPALTRAFCDAGAEYLHLVDLEGARCGGTPHFDLVSKIVRSGGLRVEIGGGIRDEETILRYLDAGVLRVILGTAAANNLAFLREMVVKYGSAIAVGVDLRDGMVAVKGWTETSGLSGMEFCKSLQEIGVQTVICTDIARDGASSLDDIRALKELGLYGAIVGKAYYTGAIDLAEAIREANA